MSKATFARPSASCRALLAGGLLLCTALSCFAQATDAKTPTAPAFAASAAAADRSALQRSVIEDDNVRIEETRLRGLPQRITVHNKTLGGNYEILVGPKGKDPSQNKSTAGQSAWSLFDF